MTREQDLLARWEKEKSGYLAWGTYVSATVEQALSTIIDPVETSYFLKSRPTPRLKNDQKLVEKAFFRNKTYADPYDDITDKVGTRFVVLLGSDIKVVVAALTAERGWTFSKDRDYEEEQKRNPLNFDYAAVHFVVRPAQELVYEGTHIPAGIPCEVQIKTILQHAYSELTHDTIYKPQIDATHSMRRNAAKAMALLEATNDYFESVARDVNEALATVREMTKNLTSAYQEAIGIPPKPTALEGLLLEAYEKSAGKDYVSEICAILKDNTFIVDNIRARVASNNIIFLQPSVLLVYAFIKRSPRDAIRHWPLTPAEMEPLLNDLGESIN